MKFNKKKLLIYKQAFFSMFKVKVQMILLILLTILASATITIAYASIRNLQKANNYMGPEIKYNYSIPLPITGLDLAYNYNNISKLNICANNDDSNCAIKINDNNLNVTVKNNIITNLELVNFLDWKNINVNSTIFKTSVIGQIFNKIVTNKNSIPNEFRIIYEKFQKITSNLFSSLIGIQMNDYYQAIYKNSNAVDYIQYPTNNDPVAIINFKNAFLNKWITEQYESTKEFPYENRKAEIYDFLEMQSELSSYLTNFTSTLRLEFLVNDFDTNFTYRLIKSNNNLKIIQGCAPTANNQVVISPQFAKINDYKIGDKIKISDYEFIISGFGGDKWTMLPSTNTLNFVPNYANEPIIFINSPRFYDKTFTFKKAVDNLSALYLTHSGQSNLIDKDLSNFKMLITSNLLVTPKTNFNNELIVKPYNANDFVNKGTILFNNSLNTYIIVITIFTFFIVTVAFLVIALIIRKATERNYSQIGTLKALGYSRFKIISSYWIYALITCLFSLPIGWAIGLGGQIAIMQIFSNLFIIPYNIIYISYEALIIGFFLLLGLTIGTATLVALKAVNNSTSNLLYSNSILINPSQLILKIYHRYFAFGNFKTRFTLVLASVSFKKMFMMLITILIASFTIAISLLVPANILTLNNSYYRDIKYKTSADFGSPIGNMPLTRYSLFPWEGINASSQDIFYPINENKIIANFIKKSSNNTWINTDTNIDNIDTTDVINEVSYNMLNSSGKAFSLGWIEGLEQKYKNSQVLSAISSIACQALQTIQGVTDSTSADWKQCITNVLSSDVPSFVKKYLNDPKLKNRFSISFNTLPYFNDKDELFTQFKSYLKVDNYNQIDAIKTNGIRADSKMILLSNDLQEKLKQPTINASKTLIPVVINKTLQVKKNLKIGNEINFKTNATRLRYLTGNANANEWLDIPNDWWGYRKENQEFVDGKWQAKANTEDIWKMVNDKLTMSNDEVTYGWNDTFGYKGSVDTGDDISQNIRVYKNLNNVVLRLPKYNNNIAGIKGISSENDSYLEQMKNQLIPTGFANQYVVEEEVEEEKNNWWVVRPYSLFWNKESTDYVKQQQLDITLDLITKSSDYFSFIGSQLHNNNTKSDGAIPVFLNQFNASINENNNYKYKVVGIHNSYNDASIFLNQDLANKIIGYDNIKSDALYQKDPFNKSNLWFNGRYSFEEELTDATTRYNIFSKTGVYTTNDSTDNYTQTIFDQDLLSIKQASIINLAATAASLISIFLISSIVIAVIIIAMITNLSLDQFSKTMAIMKVQGYTTYEINNLILTMFIPFAIVGYVIGSVGSWITSVSVIFVLGRFFGIIIPFTVTWWIFLVTFLIVALIYSLVYMLSSHHLRKLNVIELVKNSDE